MPIGPVRNRNIVAPSPPLWLYVLSRDRTGDPLQGRVATKIAVRQMLIEDVTSTPIRAARAAAKPKGRQGEDNDEADDG
jgi:hypothetical protein